MDGKKSILSLYENENLKRGNRKEKKPNNPKKTCPYAKMKKIKKGTDGKDPSYPCMKMKISKSYKKREKKLSLCKKKWGQTDKRTSYPCMKMKISKGGTEKKKKRKNMSLCKNEKNQKRDGRKKPILSLYENENFKSGEQTKQGDHLIPRRKGIAT
jgi:hypothetical protein